MSRTTTENRKRLLDAAEGYVGYTAKAGKANVFGATTGYDSLYWGGSFLDVIARESEVEMPSLAYPATALAAFVADGRLRTNPLPGDIVFYAFNAPGEPHFSVSHVGLVTDITGWKPQSTFKAIEGQTSSGLARGSQEPNGVYERIRYSTDVLVFARPRYKKMTPFPEANTVEEGKLLVRPSKLVTVSGTGKPAPEVEAVQRALAQRVPLRNAARGVFDKQTASAYASYQRLIGYVGPDATGKPDIASLVRLAHETGLFTAKE